MALSVFELLGPPDSNGGVPSSRFRFCAVEEDISVSLMLDLRIKEVSRDEMFKTDELCETDGEPRNGFSSSRNQRGKSPYENCKVMEAKLVFCEVKGVSSSLSEEYGEC
jgi:hypothetical protein